MNKDTSKNNETTKSKIGSGWKLIKDSIVIFQRYPRILVPLLFTWLVYAPAILYLKYFFSWEELSSLQSLGVVCSTIFLFAFLLVFSCSMLLELIEQIESNQQQSLSRAFKHSIQQNLLQFLPIVLMWTLVWFILTLLKALLSKRKKSNEKISAENAAKTLGGFDGRFSFSAAFLDMLNKFFRMIVFLILPAICWDQNNFYAGIKKGLSILKAHPIEFFTGYALSGLVTALVFLPSSLIIYFSSELEITLPDAVWYLLIVYMSFAWSYSIYTEQMFTAQLYLWHRKWEKIADESIKSGNSIPNMSDVEKPSLLDEIHELSDLQQSEKVWLH